MAPPVIQQNCPQLRKQSMSRALEHRSLELWAHATSARRLSQIRRYRQHELHTPNPSPTSQYRKMSHEPVNPILPQFLPHLDPQFIEIYNKYQGLLHPIPMLTAMSLTTISSPSSPRGPGLHRRIPCQYRQIHLPNHTRSEAGGRRCHHPPYPGRAARGRNPSQSLHADRSSDRSRRSEECARPIARARQLSWR